MKKIVLATLFSAMLLAAPVTMLPAGALNNEIERGYVSVSYTAEKEVSPDTVEVSIAVRTTDKKSMAVAVQKNKEISDKIYDYLKSVIKTADGDYVKTANFSASPRYVYESGRRTFDKYEVSNSVIVHTKNLEKISVMIDKSLQFGATNVDSLNFSLSEKDAQCSELLSTASKNAKQRAELVAASAGTSLNGVKSVDASCSLNNYNGRHYIQRNMMLAKTASMDAAVESAGAGQIESGVITIYANVNANFFVK